MSQSVAAPEYSLPFKLHVQQTQLTEEQFIRLCQENPDLRIELTAQGELVIMPPTSLESGWRNIRIARRLDTWTEEDGTGIAFDSSTLFTLPNGAKRSPDASWMRRERWEALPKKEREGFGSICPDFVIELRSPTDRLPDLQEKMQEYLANGAQLGWLIDPLEKRVYIYRPDQPVEVLDDPPIVNGDPVLPGFVLPVRELW
ncbi:MAG TPA: Uma2 family endonuclease [Methylomirabilota bacterium]|jgi:Uma2 family endonuclease|nr:Uma2 family endonuclease [Methylomirabilota bacterium]